MISRLHTLGEQALPELRNMWLQYYSAPPAASMSKELLRLAIGYKMQEEVCGGLSRRSRLQLGVISRAGSKVGSPGKASTNPGPKSGTKLIREWQGKAHEVLALEDGHFAYSGKTYRSLTVIARAITGTHQSGPRFFGLGQTKSSADG